MMQAEDSMPKPKINSWPCTLHPESRATNEARPRCRACKAVWRKERYDAGKRDTPRCQYNSWRILAMRRGHAVDITFRQWLYLKSQPCVYIIDDRKTKSGIDRKDNTKGYVQGNCQPCCYRHNMVKGDWFTHEQMLDVVQRHHIACGDSPRSPSIRHSRTENVSLIVRPTKSATNSSTQIDSL